LANVKGLALLGPATYGTLAGALGLCAATQQLPFFSLFPSPPAYVQSILKTFTSLYQVLPWDSSKLPSLDDPDHNIKSVGFWRGLIDPELLMASIPPGGIPWAATIDTTFYTPNITVIIGDAAQTAGGVIFRATGLTVDPSYNVPGDGFVPRACSLMADRPVTYIASETDHLHLPLSAAVISTVVDIFSGKIPTALSRFYA
jgi:hypothetical protein